MSEMDDIRCFVEVARAGGFSRAAERLGLSKSVVSRRIARLEDSLGARLLSRTTRGAALTDAGADFGARMERVLAEYEAAREAAARRSGDFVGLLRISAPLGFGLRHVAPVLAEMAAAHPRLEIDASYSDRLVDIVGERFDAAIRIGELPDSSLVARRIAPAPVAIVASPAYLAARGRPRTPADLARHECIGYTGQAVSTWRFGEGRRRVAIRVDGRLRSDNGEAIAQWAVAGLGIANIPLHFVAEAVASGALEVLFQECGPTVYGVYVLRPPGPVVSGKLRLLIDLLAERLGRGEGRRDPSAAGGGAG